MTRKKMKNLMMEISRRIYLDQHGTLKGWGKTARFYNSDWYPKVEQFGGYKAAWNSKVMLDLRKSVGM